MNDPIDPHDDPFLHRQLRSLPQPKAPPSLSPRVLALIRERAESVWWRRPIFEWPLLARAAGVSVLAALASSVAYFSGWTPGADGAMPVSGDLSLGPWQLALVGAQSFQTAVSLSVSAIPLTVWWIAGAVLMGLYAGCLGLGTLVYRQMLLRR